MLAFTALTVLFFAVRLPLLNAPWWTDESHSAFVASQPLRAVPALMRSDWVPPLHFLYLSAWFNGLHGLGWHSTFPREGVTWFARTTDRTGVATIPDGHGGTLTLPTGVTPDVWQRYHFPPVWAARCSTLLLGFLLFVAVTAFAALARYSPSHHRTIAPSHALIVALLWAISPAVARWDVVLRYYDLLSLGILGMAACLWAITAAPCLRRSWWLLPALALCTATAMLTHYMTMYFALPLGLWLLLANGRRWKRTVAGAAGMLAGLGLFLLCWGGAFREQWTQAGLRAQAIDATERNWLNMVPLQPALPQRLLVGMDGQDYVDTLFPAWWTWGMIALLSIGMIGYLLRLARREGTRLDGLLLLWIFGAPALAFAADAWRPATGALAWRYFSAAAPAAALLFVLGFESLARWRLLFGRRELLSQPLHEQ